MEEESNKVESSLRSEKYDFEKKREKLKDNLVKSISELNEQINQGEKKKKIEKDKKEKEAGNGPSLKK